MKPGEHKTVQARILKYAEDIGWTFVPREEAEQRRSFDSEAGPKDKAKGVSLFFDDLSMQRYVNSIPVMLKLKAHYRASSATCILISTVTVNLLTTCAITASSSTTRKIVNAIWF